MLAKRGKAGAQVPAPCKAKSPAAFTAGFSPSSAVRSAGASETTLRTFHPRIRTAFFICGTMGMVAAAH
jgi:hypothetical protein